MAPLSAHAVFEVSHDLTCSRDRNDHNLRGGECGCREGTSSRGGDFLEGMVKVMTRTTMLARGRRPVGVLLAATVACGALLAGVLLPTSAANANESVREVPQNTGLYRCDLVLSEREVAGLYYPVTKVTLDCSWLAPGVGVRLKLERAVGRYYWSDWFESPTQAAVTAEAVSITADDVEIEYQGLKTVGAGLVKISATEPTLTPIGWAGAPAIKNGAKVLADSSARSWLLTDTGQIQAAANPSYCLDIRNGAAKPSAPSHLWQCDKGASEYWFVLPTGAIVSQQDINYCLTARPNNPYKLLTVERCGGPGSVDSNGQTFTVTPTL